MKFATIPPAILTAYSYDPETGKFRHLRGNIPGVEKGSIAGHIGPEGYRIIQFKSHHYAAHRVAWLFMTGEQPPNDIDHINMQRDDNHFSNLRLATRAQNMWNTRAKTPFGKGVYFKTNRGKFIAQIRIGGKQTYLGCFDTPEEAQRCYAAAAAVHHGEFARVA